MNETRKFLQPEEVRNNPFSENTYLVKTVSNGRLDMKKTFKLTVQELDLAIKDKRSIFIAICTGDNNEAEEEKEE